MARIRRLSGQSLQVLVALAGRDGDWLYGLEIARETGLQSGSLYPILIRLSERGLLEARWLEPQQPGRPPRHAYRLLPAGRRALEDARPASSTQLMVKERLA